MKDQDLLIGEEASLMDALNAINSCPEKTLLVVREGKLAAVVTDGDIRRWILTNRTLEARVRQFGNYHPIYLKTDEVGQAKTYLKTYGMRVLPVVDDDMHIVRIIRSGQQTAADLHSCAGVPVVINAGGKGTRLYPYTKILPKPLIPIGEEPIAEIIINRFYDIGCDNFYMILNHKKNMIKAYFNEIEKPYSLHYAEEETPLGTGGGLKLLEQSLKNTFIFTNCDTIIEEDFETIMCAHKKRGNLVTMVCALRNLVFPYGVVIAKQDGSIEAFHEKPSMSHFVNTGCYLVEPEVLKHMLPNESIGFPTVIERLREQGLPVGIYPIGEESWMDMGQFDTLEDMQNRLGVH